MEPGEGDKLKTTSNEKLVERFVEFDRRLAKNGISINVLEPEKSKSNILDSSTGLRISFRYMNSPAWLVVTRNIEETHMVLEKLSSTLCESEAREIQSRYQDFLGGNSSRLDFVQIGPLTLNGMKLSRGGFFFEFNLDFNMGGAPKQLQALKDIYLDAADKLHTTDFDDLCNEVLSTNLAAHEAALVDAMKVKEFSNMVLGALEDGKFSDLEEENLKGISNSDMTVVQESVRGLSQRNLMRYLQDNSEVKLLCRLLKKCEEKGFGDVDLSIPGLHTDLPFKIISINGMDFWRKMFPQLTERLINDNGLVLIHNLESLDSLKYEFENGMGGEWAGLDGDITDVYTQAQATPRVTYSILGFDSPLYAKGAALRKDSVQLVMDVNELKRNTIFFPHDTGDPQTGLSDDIRERGDNVLSLVGATELLLLRHLNFRLSQVIKTGSSEEEITRLGNFGYVEANTLGFVGINKINIKEARVNSGIDLSEGPVQQLKGQGVPIIVKE